MQCDAVRCSVLQCDAVLQCHALSVENLRRIIPQTTGVHIIKGNNVVKKNVLQCAAVYCSLLLCVVIFMKVVWTLQRDAV